MKSRPTEEIRGTEGSISLSLDHWPLLLFTGVGMVSPEGTARWCEAYERVVRERKERFIHVLDATVATGLPPTSRRVIANFLKEHHSPDDWLCRLHIGSLYVLPSPLLRGMATAIFWLQRPSYQWKFAGSMDEVGPIANGWFASAGVSWSGLH